MVELVREPHNECERPSHPAWLGIDCLYRRIMRSFGAKMCTAKAALDILYWYVEATSLVPARPAACADDKWAIRVDNVRGVKVGHLPARLACHVSAFAPPSPATCSWMLILPCLQHTCCERRPFTSAPRLTLCLPLPPAACLQLAPLMDQGLLQLEGLVHAFHRPPDNKYKLPVLLSLFCEPSQRDAVHDMVDRAKAAKQAADMQRSRYQRPTPPKSPSWVADSRSNRSGRRRSDAGSDGGFVAAAPVEVRLSQKEMDDGLARLWGG